jgi:hemerythrin-like domain-containing protein
MMSHHALRRDLRAFDAALARVAGGDASRVKELGGEWTWYRNALHGHHMMEDSRIFPQLIQDHAATAPIVERLSAEHRRIDPMLERGDAAFSDAFDVAAARGVVRELSELLEAHLAVEEAELVPFLRDARSFPAPGSDAEAEQYAQGFAWSMHGIHPDVLSRVTAMLPDALTSRLPEAQAKFAERCARVWGSAEAGAARTPIPT